MAKTKQKERAIELRKAGKSIKDISSLLTVSPSTVSVWCRDISLSEKAIKLIAKNGKVKSITGLMKYSERKRANRKLEEAARADLGSKKLGTISARDIYCIGLGLYWGEGYKNGNQEFGFTNSDPAMIIFYIQWLHEVFGIKNEDLILRVSINESHKKRILEVERYWSKATSVPLTQFTKTSLIKGTSKKVYKNQSVHMGTLRIKVRKGTNLRREVLGAIRSIAYTPNSVKTRR